MKQNILGFYYVDKTPQELDELVSNCTMIAVSDYADDHMALAIKKLKPDCKVLLYFDPRGLNQQAHFFSFIALRHKYFCRSPITSFKWEDRLVYADSPFDYLMDITNGDYRTWAAGYIASRLQSDLYSGVFLDETHDIQNNLVCKFETTTIVDTPESVKAGWASGTLKFLEVLRGCTKTDKLIVANSGWANRVLEQVPFVSGIFAEGDPLYQRTHKWGECWTRT